AEKIHFKKPVDGVKIAEDAIGVVDALRVDVRYGKRIVNDLHWRGEDRKLQLLGAVGACRRTKGRQAGEKGKGAFHGTFLCFSGSMSGLNVTQMNFVLQGHGARLVAHGKDDDRIGRRPVKVDQGKVWLGERLPNPLVAAERP